MSNIENQKAIFPRGTQTSSEYFTGTAWLNILVPQDETGTYAIGNVLFEAGCRNNWHKHPAGQILLVTHGNGFYQEKGKPARPIGMGDVIVIPSNIEHWHGASKTCSLTHIVITNNSKQGAVEWLKPVSDEEYDNCQLYNS